MATELGSAFISVGMGTNTLAGDIKKAFGGAENSGADAGKSAGKGFGAAFGVAAAALGALGIGSFFKSAVSGAADLEQSIGAVDSVFKGSAGQMHEWAKSAATDVGLSANEFNELGTLIGSQLKNGGTAMDELGPKTQSLITTGADLASMFGGTTAEAVGALSSALKGERDPIERYGVSLNQAKIDAEAAALGFSKVGGSLSAEANQAATLSLIMKQTADAHGNFASEADTLAHKQQVLNAQLANGKARIGTELLPVVAAFTGLLSKALGPAISGTVAGIKEVVGGFRAFGAAFKAADGDITSNGFAGVMEHAGFIVREIVGGFRALGAAYKAADGDITSSGFAGFMERIGFAVREVTGGVRAMFAAFKAGDSDITSSGFAGFMEQVGGGARQVFNELGTALAGIWSAIGPQIAALVPMLFQLFSALSPTSLIFQALLPVLPQLATAIGGVIAMVLPLVLSLVSQLLPIVTQLVASVLPPLIDIFGNIVTSIVPLVGIIMGLLIPVIMALMPVVVTVFSVVADVIKNAMQIVQGIIQVVTGIISGDWSRVWEGIGNIFGGIWNTIVAVVGGALRIVGSYISAGLGVVSGIVGSVLGNIGRFFADTWNNVVSGVSGMIGNVVGFFSGLIGKITGAIGNAGSALFSVGKNIIQGLIDGIGSMMGAIGRAVLNIVPEAIRGPFEQMLGIASPSKVFRGYGLNIGQGLILGIGDMHGDIANAVTGMVSVPAIPSMSAGSFTAAGASVAGTGVTASFTLNQVDDPIGTSHAVMRRLERLGS